jgi:hypothetical protein
MIRLAFQLEKCQGNSCYPEKVNEINDLQRGWGFPFLWSNSNSGIWKTPRVGIAKKLGGGYIMGNFGRQR